MNEVLKLLIYLLLKKRKEKLYQDSCWKIQLFIKNVNFDSFDF